MVKQIIKGQCGRKKFKEKFKIPWEHVGGFFNPCPVGTEVRKGFPEALKPLVSSERRETGQYDLTATCLGHKIGNTFWISGGWQGLSGVRDTQEIAQGRTGHSSWSSRDWATPSYLGPINLIGHLCMLSSRDLFLRLRHKDNCIP